MHRPRRAACAALLALLLSACATPRPPPGSDWLAGRLSVQVRSEPPRQLSSAFELRGDAEQGQLQLTSPLGSVVASASWAPGRASLVSSEGTKQYDDLDTLARDAFGEALPLRALPAWLRGRPWPGAPHRAVAEGFEQLGWTISLARYAEGFLDVTRDTPPAVALRARLERPTP